MSIKRILIATFSILILAFVVLAFYIGYSFFSSESCSSTYLDSELSPSKKLVMTVYNYDCGATSGYTTNISVQKANEQNPHQVPSSNDSAFFAIDSDHGKVPDLLNYSYGGPKVVINWIDESTVEIEYPKDSRVFQNDASIEKISIKYLPQEILIPRDLRWENVKEACSKEGNVYSVKKMNGVKTEYCSPKAKNGKKLDVHFYKETSTVK